MKYRSLPLQQSRMWHEEATEWISHGKKEKRKGDKVESDELGRRIKGGVCISIYIHAWFIY